MFAIIVWPPRAFQAKEGKNVRLAVKSGAPIPALLMLPDVAWMLFYNLNAGLLVSVPLALAAIDNKQRDDHMRQTIVTSRVSAVDHSFPTVSFVLFDVFYVPGGASAEALCSNADAVMFAKEAYKHGKVIAASGEGELLIREAAQSEGEAQGAFELSGVGIGKTADAAFSKRFADAVAQHRFPERADVNAIVA